MKPSLLSVALLAALASPVLAETDPSTLIDRGYWREAETLLAARVAAAPADGAALANLARVRAQQGRLDEAGKLAERAIAAAPNLAAAHYAAAEVCGAQLEHAGLLKAPGLAKRFKKEAESTLAIDPRHPDALESLIQFHLQAPGIAGGDKKKIPALLDQLAAADPVAGWRARAELAMHDKDSTQAESCLRKAVEAETKGADSHMALARWLSPARRHPDEAERLALEALAREPWRQEAWALVAGLRAHQGRIAEMNETLASAEAADPTRLGAYYTAGRQLLMDGRELERSEQCFRHYLTREPEFGWPSHGGAHWRLGQLLEKRGEKSAAIAELETAIKLQPDLADAKKDLKRLKG